MCQADPVKYQDRVVTEGPAKRSLREDNMPFMGKFFAIAMLSLAFTATAGAQAPQVEKNVSMKMALMIIEHARAVHKRWL